LLDKEELEKKEAKIKEKYEEIIELQKKVNQEKEEDKDKEKKKGK